MSILGTLGLSSSDADKNAALARAASLKAIKKQLAVTKGATKQAAGALQTGTKKATGALAPSIAAAGEYLAKQNQGYDVAQSLYGITDPALGTEAFNRSLSPLRNRAFEDIARLNAGAGTFGSGNTMTDLSDYIAQNEFDPYRREVAQQFNPYQAIALQGQLGGKQADIYGNLGTNLSNLYTGQATNTSNIYGAQGAANSGYFDKIAANQGAVGQNWLGLAGNILGAGATLAGMRVPGAGAAKLPTYASYGPQQPYQGFGMGGG